MNAGRGRNTEFDYLPGTCPSASEGYPFVCNQNHSPDYIRQFPHLRTRVSSVCSMLRVRHEATKAFNRYMDEHGFFHTQAPVLTSNDCEGAGEVIFNGALHSQNINKRLFLFATFLKKKRGCIFGRCYLLHFIFSACLTFGTGVTLL